MSGVAAVRRPPARPVGRGLRRENAALRRQLAQLRHAATHDPLTGMLNRTGLIGAWTRPAWLAIVDLDGFKPVNDTYGHAAGDHVLTVIAARLDAQCEVAARLGGDEFAVSVRHIRHARELQGMLADPIRLPSGAWVRVTAAVGVTVAGPHDLSSGLHRADAAMYASKRTGWVEYAGDAVADHATRPAVRARDAEHRREATGR